MILAEQSEEVGTLGSRVFVYGTLATTAVALALAFAFGLAWFFSMREADELRKSAHEARASAQTCRMQAERLDAQLDQLNGWLMLARDGKKHVTLGGVGGP